MERLDYIPADYKRIKIVGSLSELFNEQFGGSDGVNCILYPRKLMEDFNALARYLQTEIPALEDDKLLDGLAKAAASGIDGIAEAAKAVFQDIELATAGGATPYFRAVLPGDKSYELQTYLHEDHIGTDEKTVRRGVILTCYTTPVTEYMRQEDVGKKLGDMFYLIKPYTKAFRFGVGDIWRHAGSYEEGISVVPPFVHAAPWRPFAPEGAPPRLLMVGL